METLDRVKELIAGYLANEGIELVDATYRREQGGMTLRLLVDKPAGITLDECEAVNNYVGDLIEKEGTIDEHYILEVASPGLDRPLHSGRDFERVMGRDLTVTTYEPIDGKRQHEGTLIGMDTEQIILEAGGISTVIPRAKVAKAVLKIEV